MEVMAELGVDDMPVVAVAKGPDRDAGRERFFMPGREPFMLEPKSPVLYYLQRLRDEAHRFAIGTHRGAAHQARSASSVLDGSRASAPSANGPCSTIRLGQGVEQAGLADLERVPGINRAVARTIHDYFHDGG